MEIVRAQNANAIAEFYLLKVFRKVGNLKIFLENSKFLILFKKMQRMILLLYEFSRGNQVDGSPLVASCIPNRSVLKRRAPAKKF